MKISTPHPLLQGLNTYRPFRCAFSVACLILLCLSFSACNKSKNEINDEFSSGVVLILNRYYYALTIPEGATFYFAGSENEVTGFGDNPDSVAITVTGTGFFISNDGLIATNKHVVASTVSDDVLKRSMKDILRNLVYYLKSQNDSCEQIMNWCRLQYFQSDSESEKSQYEQLFNLLSQQIEENNSRIDLFKEIDPNYAQIRYENMLYVAYNGTFVNSINDMYKCSLRDTSRQDVAIIQLNNKQTPPDKYVFHVPDKNMLQHYSFGEYLARMFGSDKNDQFYMIGFNRGFFMGNTSDGLYSQCTEGSLNQDLKETIQYSITTEPGSSGSPVCNRRGQLVAVNYAGFRGTQGFNYGVKSKFLYDLMHKD